MRLRILPKTQVIFPNHFPRQISLEHLKSLNSPCCKGVSLNAQQKSVINVPGQTTSGPPLKSPDADERAINQTPRTPFHVWLNALQSGTRERIPASAEANFQNSLSGGLLWRRYATPGSRVISALNAITWSVRTLRTLGRRGYCHGAATRLNPRTALVVRRLFETPEVFEILLHFGVLFAV